jgi:hypothetical protein
MILYERRIENSAIKLMKELKRFQIMRRIELEDTEPQFEPSPSLRNQDATGCASAEKNGDLKKQSQYVPAMIGVTPFVKGFYGIESAAGDEENKAKKACPEPVERSQFGAPFGPEGVPKRDRSPAEAAG